MTVEPVSDLQMARAADAKLADVVLVAIGRNEGERLRQCLRSVVDRAAGVVYVDSGSTDGSVGMARAAGVDVVDLDMGTPFTAARARNAGVAAFRAAGREFSFVQFVDGDCEVEDGWLAAARDALIAAPRTACVFGRRRERYPNATIYNRLCDEEWNVRPGEVDACGGDAMFRADAFEAEGGYREDLIAGEEPELCLRLKRRGWKIVCLAHPMTIHDAAITRFGQWWRRSVRTGYAYAERAHIYRNAPERYLVAPARRTLVWGAGVPAATAAATLALGPIGLVPALVYPLQIARLYLRQRTVSAIPLRSAAFMVLINFPAVVGQLMFYVNRLRGRATRLIEYK